MPTHSTITMSVFELLKAGPGPSSSHTIGPMRAGADFAALAGGLPAEVKARVKGLRVRLWGSLSATGRGHGTDRAVIAGLMGYEPIDCPPGLLGRLNDLSPEAKRLQGFQLPIGSVDLHYGPLPVP